MANTNKNIIKRLRNKYRLVIMNDSTFEEVLTYRLSRINVFALASIISIVLLSLGILLIALTPLREFIPNYPDGTMRKNIQMNAIMIDSLENELRIRDQYFENLKAITMGNETKMHEPIQDTDIQINEINDEQDNSDSLLVAHFIEDEFFNVSPATVSAKEMNKMYFYPPLNGIITNKFDTDEKHFGIDMVAAPESAVLSCLSGTVILATWTLETGNIIQIQHENDLISVYKHNSKLLKNTGEFVRAGEAIAIIGNSGELSTGPHLHFELWHKGTPVDPEKYIKF